VTATADPDLQEYLLRALATAQAIEDGITVIRHQGAKTFADLRELDAQLADAGFPTKKPALLEGDGSDLNRCCDLARDVSGRIRLAVAMHAMTAVSPAGSA
jgi:hypothetical protein